MSGNNSRPDSPQHRPSTNRGVSSPQRQSLSHRTTGSSTSAHDSSDGPARTSGMGGIEPRHHRKGLTLEELEDQGLVDDIELSKEFEGATKTEKEIKKLPKKLRAYYEHLAQVYEHYQEVDSLMGGEMASTIANSFVASKHRARGRQFDGGLVDAPKPKKDRSSSSDKNKKKGQNQPNQDEEAGEDTGLLESSKEEKKHERTAKIALHVTTGINILLVIAKGVAVLYSSSISLTASLVDSALDMLSTFIILGTSWAIGIKKDAHMYPAGKRRFEPLGVLIFSVAMIASFVQVFIESFERAIGRTESKGDLSKIGMGTMLATIGTKAILWLWCSRIPSSGVQALAQDAENDVWLNSMSLIFPWVGSLLHWKLLDPIGGMVLSVYITFEWVKTLLQNFANLSGKSASRDQIARVLYLVSRFKPVLEIGDVECYHIGDELIVEVDVILPHTSTLHFAHDVGETIQCMLEGLEGVMRAYVHCDYSAQNPPQHTSRVPGTASKTPSRLSSGYGSNGQTVNGSSSSSGSATPKPKSSNSDQGSSTEDKGNSQDGKGKEA